MSDAPTAVPMPHQLNVAEKAVADATARLAEIDSQITHQEGRRDAAVQALKDLKTERVQAERVANSLKPRASRTAKS